MSRVKPRSAPARLSQALPRGACDAHVHVFRPDLYPYAADRAYTPGRVTVGQLRRFLDEHSLSRVVIVQPSVYGFDNRAMLDGLRELGARVARGVAVVDIATVEDNELADLDRAGVAGLRLNVTTRERGDLAKALRAADKRLAGSPWHVQIYAPIAALVAAEREIARLKRAVVLDHFGGIRAGHPGAAEGLRTLMRLTRDGPAWVKLSGAYRVSLDRATMWNDAAPLAVALIEAAPDRLVWGSDWPHTGGHDRKPGSRLKGEPFQRIDDHAALAALADWAGEPAVLRRILVTNPAKLYGFAP